MKKFLLIILILSFIFDTQAEAQTIANAKWALTSNQNAIVNGNVVALAQVLQGLNHSSYTSGGQRTISPGNLWPAESASNVNRHIQYAIYPINNQTFSINQIEASLSFNGSSNVRVNVTWSTDGVNFNSIVNNLVLNSSATPTPYIFDNLNIRINYGDTLYLKISPWAIGVINSPTGTLVSKDVKINGLTSPVPQAIWPLTTNQTPSYSGDITVNNQKLNNLFVNNYISGNGGQRILPISGNWPAEVGANEDRYIEYKISPIAPHDLTVKQISIPLSFNSSSYAHAKIAWSSDGVNFIDLATDISLTSGSIPVEYNFDPLNIKISRGKSLYLRVYPWTTVSLNDRYLVSKNVSLKLETNVVPQEIAFPGAEGGGRNTIGGRGGAIYYVTNLNDSGVGSLIDAISQGNRTILFKISGTIFLNSPIVIQKDNITIAGQTAPGDGICLANYGLNIRANNIIIRYLRSRPGDIITNPGDSTKQVDAMYNSFGTPITNPFRNIIVDHCSLSWSTDEAASFYAIADFTLQWSIISESLYRAAHPKPTPHGYGGIWGGQNASFHHNLLASHSNRNPRFSGSESNGQPELEYVDFRNNVIFNWYGGTYSGIGGHQNMVNNYYKSGPATAGTFRKRRILSYSNTTSIPDGKFYINGNYVYGFPDVTASNWDGVELASGILMDSVRVNSPFTYSPVETQSAEDAYTSVLNHAGAFLPKRDTVDRRIVKEVQTGIATFADTSFSVSGMVSPSGIIDSQNTVGGWPTLNATPYPKDSDNDGLPDWWEAMQNGNTTDSLSINRNSYDSDGYTFLEKYINGIPSPDEQVVFTNINGYKSINSDTLTIDFNINWAKDQFKFELYRSTDNINFIKITELNSDINKTKYSFFDTAPNAPIIYYKVGSIKKDDTGTINYSNITMISGSEGTLSVEILSFKANRSRKNGNVVEFVWETSPEYRIRDFILERKNDVNNFDVVKTIPATTSIKYAATDNHPARTLSYSYYRLKINEINGKQSYSKIIAVSNALKEEFSLYPNPAAEQITLIHPPAQAGSKIYISDINGKAYKVHIPNVNDTLSVISVVNFVSGSYVLTFSNLSNQKSILFIKK